MVDAFDDLSAVIDMCTFVVCCMPHDEALKLIVYCSGQSVLWNHRAIAYPLLLNPKNSCHALVRS